MRTIHKYPLHGSLVLLPKGAKIIEVARQGNAMQIWAEIDTEEEQFENVNIVMLGTGWNIPENAIHLKTVHDGEFVWHFYEVKS